MSAFVRTAADVHAAGEPRAKTMRIDGFHSAEEKGEIVLYHRTEGYDPKGTTFTRWLCEAWYVEFPDGTANTFVGLNAEKNARENFRTARAQIG